MHLYFLVRGRLNAAPAPERKGKAAVPEKVAKARFWATCLTTVTFVVTVCILIPWYGHPEFFLLQSNGLFHHLLCPVLAVASLPLLDRMEKRDCAFAMIPTLLYGLVMYTMNFLRIVDGPYPFLRVYAMPWYMSLLWFFVIAGGAYGIAVVLRKLCGKKRAGF